MVGQIKSKKTDNTISGTADFVFDKVQYQCTFKIEQNELRNSITILKIMQWDFKEKKYSTEIEKHYKIFNELKKKMSNTLINSKSLLSQEHDKKLFADKIVMVDPSLLKINPYQKDYFSEGGTNREKRRQLLESIKKFGIKNPLQITQDYTIIAGQRRTGCALELRHESVPCRIALYELTDDELKLHLLEDNYLNRDQGSKQRKKIYSDLMELVKRQIPNFDHLIREKKTNLQSDLEGMGLSTKTTEKILIQERRKAAKIDNSRRKGIIQTDYDSMIKNVNRLVSVYENTNSDTQEKIKNILIKKLEGIK